MAKAFQNQRFSPVTLIMETQQEFEVVMTLVGTISHAAIERAFEMSAYVGPMTLEHKRAHNEIYDLLHRFRS